MGAFQDAVAGRIKALEVRFGSRANVAEAVNVNRSTITRWAEGSDKQRPNLGNCLKIDQLLPNADPPLADL